MDSLALADALDDLVHNAPSIPFRGEARMDREELTDLLARLREAVRHEIEDPERTATWVVLERLDALVLAAEPVRFLGGVRINRDEIYDLLDQIRALLPEELKRSGGY